MWEYYSDDSEKLATFYNTSGIAILDVFAGRNAYFSIPHYTFISSYQASYSYAHNISGEKDCETPEESAKKRLKAACYLIEQDYKSQVSKIKKVIE